MQRVRLFSTWLYCFKWWPGFNIVGFNMHLLKKIALCAGLAVAASANAGDIRITPVDGTDFGTVQVGSSRTLRFDLDSSTGGETLRHIALSSNSGDGWGSTPPANQRLDPGNCNPQWNGTGTSLSPGSGCRFTITFTPTASGASNSYLFVSNYQQGLWDSRALVAAAALPAGVPTLSQWGMLVMSAALAVFALLRLRRK